MSVIYNGLVLFIAPSSSQHIYVPKTVAGLNHHHEENGMGIASRHAIPRKYIGHSRAKDHSDLRPTYPDMSTNVAMALQVQTSLSQVNVSPPKHNVWSGCESSTFQPRIINKHKTAWVGP